MTNPSSKENEAGDGNRNDPMLREATESPTKEKTGAPKEDEDEINDLPSKKDSWVDMLQQLIAFKDEHGDCLVPSRFTKNRKLGFWVMTQRRQYILLRQGRPSTLTRARIEALEGLGFVWQVRRNKHRHGFSRETPKKPSSRLAYIPDEIQIQNSRPHTVAELQSFKQKNLASVPGRMNKELHRAEPRVAARTTVEAFQRFGQHVREDQIFLSLARQRFLGGSYGAHGTSFHTENLANTSRMPSSSFLLSGDTSYFNTTGSPFISTRPLPFIVTREQRQALLQANGVMQPRQLP